MASLRWTVYLNTFKRIPIGGGGAGGDDYKAQTYPYRT